MVNGFYVLHIEPILLNTQYTLVFQLIFFMLNQFLLKIIRKILKLPCTVWFQKDVDVIQFCTPHRLAKFSEIKHKLNYIYLCIFPFSKNISFSSWPQFFFFSFKIYR